MKGRFNQRGIIEDDPLGEGAVVNGRYEIRDVVADGGFARVYSVWDRLRERVVALKVLDPTLHWRDPILFERRLTQEAVALSRILHPCTVAIYDMGHHGEARLPYIAMELLEGETLRDALKRSGGISPERAWSLFLPALDALALAHQIGIVHKDLKPENLFLMHRDGVEHMIILDFGMAHLNASSRLTVPGQICGTPQYLAPEYISKQLVTPALDVYQMALILVEMLTGKQVVAANGPFECMAIHSNAKFDLPPLVTHSSLGLVIARALALDHTRRHQNAGAFKEALEGIDPTQLLEKSTFWRHHQNTGQSLPSAFESADMLPFMTQKPELAVDISMSLDTPKGIENTEPTPASEETSSPAVHEPRASITSPQMWIIGILLLCPVIFLALFL